MVCIRCKHGTAKRFGYYGKRRIQRFRCRSCRVRSGNPDFSRISTSHIERANLSVRMHLRRFARKTSGISKTLDNLKAAVALYVAWYNFCRPHLSLRVTPAMQAGLTDHVWTVEELICWQR